MTSDTVRRASRLDSLTGLRAFAALAVFLTHVAAVADARTQGSVHVLTRPGYVGVSFFFVLSGFVLTWSRRPGDRASSFYRRRVSRIYPVYIVTWVAAGVLAVVGVLPKSGHVGSALGAVLLQAWIPKENVYYALNGVAWSLSAEAFFYLTFPLYADRLKGCGRAVRRGIFVAAVLVLVALAVVGQSRIPAAQYTGTQAAGFWLWLIYNCPLVRVLEFVMGVILALEVRDGLSVPCLPAWAFASFAALLAAGEWPNAFSRSCYTLVPFLGLIAAAATRDNRGLRSFFSTGAVVRLGEWSFSFYMVHQLLTHAVSDHYRAHGWVALPVAVGLLVSSVAAAAGLFYVVERPWDRRLRGGQAPPVTMEEISLRRAMPEPVTVAIAIEQTR
ncbi:acyltransferase [Acidothermaceae bacterium B102]|nr:acyltransferase [Acidothermaceae bacterium B102]